MTARRNPLRIRAIRVKEREISIIKKTRRYEATEVTTSLCRIDEILEVEVPEYHGGFAADCVGGLGEDAEVPGDGVARWAVGA